MKEETKEAATPTIAEKLGIKYKEVDGLFYPMWGESNVCLLYTSPSPRDTR